MNHQTATELWQNSATEEVKFYFDPLTYDLIGSKEQLPQEWKKSLLLYLFVSTVIKVTVVVNKAYYCYELHTIL